ncbi:hypothetical protein DL770_008056 [Monosporascus sp. CRB-9-2]|nr:hypothetical protein DL770_008056 [Monosporascus sp. CRB-9-2]
MARSRDKTSSSERLLKTKRWPPAKGGSRADNLRKLLEEWVARRKDLAETEGGGARSPRAEDLAATWPGRAPEASSVLRIIRDRSQTTD